MDLYMNSQNFLVLDVSPVEIPGSGYGMLVSTSREKGGGKIVDEALLFPLLPLGVWWGN